VAKTDQTLRIQFKNQAGPVEAALGAFRIGRRLNVDVEGQPGDMRIMPHRRVS